MPDVGTVATVVGLLGGGVTVQALIGYIGNRKKTASEANKIDVDTQLAYLNAVIVRLDEENKRAQERDQRNSVELAAEQERSAKLRARVRELEDEIDGVRRSARETQTKCDDLANRLKELVKDSQGDDRGNAQ